MSNQLQQNSGEKQNKDEVDALLLLHPHTEVIKQTLTLRSFCNNFLHNSKPFINGM